MERRTIEIQYSEWKNSELSEEWKMLITRALEESNRAYAPYSKFCVGCALQLANGEISGGNNQENAAYPSGLCAERVAVFSAKAKFPSVAIRKIVIVAKRNGKMTESPTPPCGACLQVLAEAESRQLDPIELLLAATEKSYAFASVSQCLPFHFIL